jgi:hypothetical protein
VVFFAMLILLPSLCSTAIPRNKYTQPKGVLGFGDVTATEQYILAIHWIFNASKAHRTAILKVQTWPGIVGTGLVVFGGLCGMNGYMGLLQGLPE